MLGVVDGGDDSEIEGAYVATSGDGGEDSEIEGAYAATSGDGELVCVLDNHSRTKKHA